MSNAGPRNDRTCIVTRTTMPADRLVRFVAGPDGRIVPDLKRRLPGRGAWVTASADVVERAVAKGMFARALKAQVTADADLARQVGDLLERRALDALGLAARAGEVVSGFAKVEHAARAGRLALVFAASDGASDGRRKVAGAVSASGGTVSIVDAFTAEQLGLALGRTNVVHAGVASGRIATSLEAAVMRYVNYRDGATKDVCAA